MGNGFHHQQSIRHFRHRNIFLPMFCRLSVKDIKPNDRHKHPIPAADEPSSPKVSCIGQVKRNNRVIAYPGASAAAGVATHRHKRSKLKKLFSRKSLLAAPLPPAASGGGGSCTRSRELCLDSSRRLKLKMNDGDGCGALKVVNIGELDPPLPVVKRVAPPEEGRQEVNIWKRRCNGTALKRLQIRLPSSDSQQPTV